MLYGALNFELSPQTTLFAGASYQKDKTDAFNASLPRWQNGADLNLPRSTTMGAPWGWMERENISLFANVQHIFNDDWKTQFNVRHNIGDDGINTAEMEGAVNYETLESQWWRNQSKTDFKETTVDLNLQGSFNLFDQKHDVILGIDHSNSTKDYKENWIYYGNGNAFEHVAPPEWAYPPTDWETINQTTNKKTGLYGSLRFRPVENLALIAGGRYILKDNNNVHNFKALTGTNPNTKTLQDKLFIPYFGIVYDVTDRTTLYASSAEIYKSQANLLDVNNQPLDPITGTNYEIGIKSTLFNDQLNTSFALYQVKKEGEGNRISGSRSSPCCYIDSGLYESKGFDLEVNGNITPEWDISVGYTYNDNENKNNTSKPLNSYTPKHLLKVWTNYKLDQFVEGLEVGGGVTAQSKNYKDGWVQAYNPLTGKYDGAWNEMQVVQPKYSLWSLRAAYAINPNLNLALNLNNIFDKRYYSTIGEPGYGSFYGEPRSFLLTLKAKY
jgi:outer membrane receptor for ferric coprogen and ferric-rhodotorulic acid